ncbi:hypothetical protein KCV07_g289, partial [Aureobasidium melanogenum]
MHGPSRESFKDPEQQQSCTHPPLLNTQVLSCSTHTNQRIERGNLIDQKKQEFFCCLHDRVSETVCLQPRGPR